jgi:HEAT repeat protein
MESVEYYLEIARTGGFHALLELDHGALTALQAAYRSEADPNTRSLIVHAIWEHRQPAALDFLGEALLDPAPEVWKQALDGLVTLASPEALRALQSAAKCEQNKERRDWIEEAIEQFDTGWQFCPGMNQ